MQAQIRNCTDSITDPTKLRTQLTMAGGGAQRVQQELKGRVEMRQEPANGGRDELKLGRAPEYRELQITIESKKLKP